MELAVVFSWNLRNLEKIGYKAIYIDEFAIAGTLNKMYSWGRGNKSLTVCADKREKSLYCVLAVSDEKIEGYKIQDHGFNGEEFSEFLSLTFHHYKAGQVDGDENVLLIFDNASFHVGNHTVNALRELGLKGITTPAYTP